MVRAFLQRSILRSAILSAATWGGTPSALAILMTRATAL